MPDRKKILIIENDDFLREILGNILHKKNKYIINGFCIKNGINNARGKNIHTVVLGTSCKDYNGKHSLNHIKKELGSQVAFFILNDTDKEIPFVPQNQQMKLSELSLDQLIENLSS